MFSVVDTPVYKVDFVLSVSLAVQHNLGKKLSNFCAERYNNYVVHHIELKRKENLIEMR